MDLLERINSLTDDQLRLIADRDDASGVLASYRLAELRGLPAPDRSVVVMGEDYAIVAQDGKISRVATEGMAKIIRQEGGKFCVYSHDGSQAFGCYDTRDEAEERLRQIHYFADADDEGDFVRLEDGRVGRIWHIMYDGVAEIPAGPTITATQDDPAALVVIYERTEDGWRETDTVSGGRLRDLVEIDPLTKAIREGSFVSWNSSGGRARGQIERITSTGTINVPDSSFSIDGTEDDPAALIRIWRPDSDGGWRETDTLVGHRMSTLTQIDSLKGERLGKATKREDGEDFPAEAFAYVPDPERVSTWKLRLWDSLSEKETRAQVSRAVQALSPSGFRGNRVEIPAADLAGVKRRVLAAWRRVNEEDAEVPAVLRSATLKESFKPPQGVQEAAQRALEWISEGHAGSGFTDVGRARAAQLARGDNVSEETIRRISSYLARHEPDKQAEGFKAGEDGFPSPGRVAWDAWGGDPGQRWADAIVERLEAAEKQACPVATMSPNINAAYRQAAAEVAMYGPMDLEEPGSFWEDIAEHWKIPLADARERTCGNCAAFDQTPAMMDCIEAGTGQTAGVGYCRIYDFLCSEERTCASWGEGGPIKALAKAEGFVRKTDEKRFTLGPLYVPDFMDAHGEWTDANELQAAVWEWVKGGDRRIYLQHDRDVEAGEWVEVMTMPQAWTVTMREPGGTELGEVTYPPNTVFLGVQWNEKAWEMIKAGQLRGYSIGGFSDRVMADLPDKAARDGVEMAGSDQEVELAKVVARAVTEALLDKRGR